jgi:hypothetical protein
MDVLPKVMEKEKLPVNVARMEFLGISASWLMKLYGITQPRPFSRLNHVYGCPLCEMTRIVSTKALFW